MNNRTYPLRKAGTTLYYARWDYTNQTPIVTSNKAEAWHATKERKEEAILLLGAKGYNFK